MGGSVEHIWLCDKDQGEQVECTHERIMMEKYFLMPIVYQTFDLSKNDCKITFRHG